MRIRDPGWVNSDPGSWMERIRIRHPGWEKFGTGINIPDPQHCITLNIFSIEDYKIANNVFFFFIESSPTHLQDGTMRADTRARNLSVAFVERGIVLLE
jgi:hypothetical protein